MVNWNFFELFGPPCGNPLANVDGSMSECAQVCALHTRPHLTMLRKTETVDDSVALGVIRKTGITSPNFWPTPVSDGSIHMRQLDRGGINLFPHAAYMPPFLIVSKICGRKVWKWWKIRFFLKLFGPPCRIASPILTVLYQNVRRSVPYILNHIRKCWEKQMVAVLCTNETTPHFFEFLSF